MGASCAGIRLTWEGDWRASGASGGLEIDRRAGVARGRRARRNYRTTRGRRFRIRAEGNWKEADHVIWPARPGPRPSSGAVDPQLADGSGEISTVLR
jgi:hypothetical protein